MYLNTRIFPTTGYARVLLFMFIGREIGGTGTGCLFQFTYCGYNYIETSVLFRELNFFSIKVPYRPELVNTKKVCSDFGTPG